MIFSLNATIILSNVHSTLICVWTAQLFMWKQVSDQVTVRQLWEADKATHYWKLIYFFLSLYDTMVRIQSWNVYYVSSCITYIRFFMHYVCFCIIEKNILQYSEYSRIFKNIQNIQVYSRIFKNILQKNRKLPEYSTIFNNILNILEYSSKSQRYFIYIN